MERIKPSTKAIADAHINARLTDRFDNYDVTSKEEVFELLRGGRTFEQLMDEIEMRFCTITSVMIARQLSAATESYRQGIYKGFKILLQTK